jgi:hypothetical protein
MKLGTKIKTEMILDWVKEINEHWNRCGGILNNDKHFWNGVYHSKNKNHWADFVEVARELQLDPECAEYFAQSPSFNKGLREVESRLNSGMPVIKKWAKEGYNVPVHKCVMDFKDIINAISGNPTKQFNKPSAPPPSDLKGSAVRTAGPKTTAQETAKIRMFNSLFEIESTK